MFLWSTPSDEIHALGCKLWNQVESLQVKSGQSLLLNEGRKPENTTATRLQELIKWQQHDKDA